MSPLHKYWGGTCHPCPIGIDAADPVMSNSTDEDKLVVCLQMEWKMKRGCFAISTVIKVLLHVVVLSR